MNRFSRLVLGVGLAAASLSAPAVAAAPVAAGDAKTTANKPTPVDPAALALAHQILDIAFPPEKRSDLMASMMESITEQTRKNVEGQLAAGDKDFEAMLDRSTQHMYDAMKASVSAAVPDYFESFARAYARDFSREDLEAILAFVKTPAGQHYFSRAPELFKDPDVQAAGQRMSAQLLAKVPEITRDTMRDVEDYVAKKQKEEKAAAPTPVS